MRNTIDVSNLVTIFILQVCTQTAKALKEENAKWLLNIQWQMTGVDVHVDTNIGKHMTALGQTLTTLTGIYKLCFFSILIPSFRST